MALVLGTNCGFVTVAPVADPEGEDWGLNGGFTDRVTFTKDTSSASAIKINEIGWWSDDDDAEKNFEIGLYADDGGVPGDLLESELTNTKTTGIGWKTVSVDWAISSSTDYWIAVQMDGGTLSTANYGTSGGSGIRYKSDVTTLENPASSDAFDADGMAAFYAVWEAEAPTGTNMKINIGDTFKDVDSMKINIGDTWKDVNSASVNVGDSWKTVF